MATPEEEEERDWSELPSELLHLIAKKLPDLLNFICFRAACKPWRSSAPLSDPPPQLPWLVEYFKRERCSGLRKQQRYYSVASEKTLTIPFKNRKPRLKYWVRFGVCSHYLTFDNDGTLSFLNPLTKDLFFYVNGCIIMTASRDHSLCNDIGEWCLYDPRNNKRVERKGFFYASCFWKDMSFSTSERSPTEVFDADSNELLYTIPPPENEVLNNQFDRDKLALHLRKSYLLESPRGILRVSWFYNEGIFFSDQRMKTIEESVFHIYRIDFERTDGKPCWVRIADIGDQILFLDTMYGFSLTARPSTGFKQGCVYFIDPWEYIPYVYDVLTGTIEKVPCPFKRCTWFLPGL